MSPLGSESGPIGGFLKECKIGMPQYPNSTRPPPPPKNKKKAQVISPTACGALFSTRTTPQPSQNLVEPSWNLTSGPPRTTPEPIWAETPKLSAVGEQRKNVQSRSGLRSLGPLDSGFPLVAQPKPTKEYRDSKKRAQTARTNRVHEPCAPPS